MSAEEEGKIEFAPVAPDALASPAPYHAAARIPDDAWGVTLSFIPTVDAMALSTAASWLRDVVLATIRYIKMELYTDAFPAPRFTSLEDVSIAKRVNLSLALPALLLCPRVQKLAIHCDNTYASDDVIAHLPLFPRLCSVLLDRVEVDSRLGKALASCETLLHVQMRSGLATSIPFLAELREHSSLRTLSDILLKGDEDAASFSDSVRMWSEMEDLSVSLASSGAAIAAVVSAIADSCPRLRRMHIRGARLDSEMTPAASAVIASMLKLHNLFLHDFILHSDFFPCLYELPSLEMLQLYCVMEGDGEGWNALATLVAKQQALTSLRIGPNTRKRMFGGAPLPSASLLLLLRAIAGHPSLMRVTVSERTRSWTSEAMVRMGEALAAAVLRSPVRTWQFHAPFALLPFLRVWEGRTPAAALKELTVWEVDVDGVEDVEGCAALLLSCLRRCGSLRRVHMDLRNASDLLASLMDAVRAEPLGPLVLTVAVGRMMYRTFSERVKGELQEVGLVVISDVQVPL